MPYIRPWPLAHLWSSMKPRFDVSCRELRQNEVESDLSRDLIGSHRHACISIWFRSHPRTCSQCFDAYAPIVDAGVSTIVDVEYPWDGSLIQVQEYLLQMICSSVKGNGWWEIFSHSTRSLSNGWSNDEEGGQSRFDAIVGLCCSDRFDRAEWKSSGIAKIPTNKTYRSFRR